MGTSSLETFGRQGRDGPGVFHLNGVRSANAAVVNVDTGSRRVTGWPLPSLCSLCGRCYYRPGCLLGDLVQAKNIILWRLRS